MGRALVSAYRVCLAIFLGSRLETYARPLLRAAGVFRWAAIAIVAMNAIAHPPPVPVLAIAWLAMAGAYATVLPALGERLTFRGAAYMARGLAVADLGSLVALFAIYRGDPPDGLYGAAVLLLLEAMLAGATPGLAAIAGLLMVAFLLLGLLDLRVKWMDVMTRSVFVLVAAAGLAATRSVLQKEAEPPPSNGADSGHRGGGNDQAREPPTPPAGVARIHLTNREREVLSLLASGYSNVMIAKQLHLTESTVKGYVESILDHFNARNRAEAVAVASRLKLVD